MELIIRELHHPKVLTQTYGMFYAKLTGLKAASIFLLSRLEHPAGMEAFARTLSHLLSTNVSALVDGWVNIVK